MSVQFKTVAIDGINIFYREAGQRDKPKILLLHGFPSSSHMYRDLIRDLQQDFHLVAPDYPGFGNSDMPALNEYEYTFDNLSVTIEKFIEAIQWDSFALFMQDYGSPVGYRIALRKPQWIKALLVQNGNAYLDGLGPALDDGKRYWANRNAETENVMAQVLTVEGTRFQYLNGVGQPEKIAPEAWQYDQYFLDRPGNKEIQLALLYDYRNNLTLYPAWQQWLRDKQPPALLTWGKNDVFFTEAGARAYLKDLPNAQLHLFDSGHFALEEYHEEIAALIKPFLQQLA
ncbi:alpha/beta hydrolase [Paraflavitalea sp. CAU 1676]|uniref:alpha/beta fold hydrolase n=1 Tax=Paraflavitalea sp. CAU 1676 TaxID=3032598 RepID=UPI0023DCD8FF|nr:alpha/beta hydrolase [Paraflavitalea sp. CAU 1676]MDF2190655.1 alpha/beta hydrolase [Paraflavitalea sp. CAU 1676]